MNGHCILKHNLLLYYLAGTVAGHTVGAGTGMFGLGFLG